MALPAAAPQQQVMAVSVLACERGLADLDGPAGWLEEASRAVLAQVPQAAQWACGLTRGVAISPKAIRWRSAPATVHTTVKGIAQACVPQPDEMLYDLLAAAIGEYAAWSGRDARRSTRRNTAMVAIAPLTRRPSFQPVTNGHQHQLVRARGAADRRGRLTHNDPALCTDPGCLHAHLCDAGLGVC
jgi:hypothetical protein